ncbi:9251_t:CDS:2, partial [Funneliformis geosporum]
SVYSSQPPEELLVLSGVAASNFFSRQTNLILTTQQVLTRVISLIVETYQGDLDSGTFFSYQKTEKKEPTVAIKGIYYINSPLSRPDITSSEDLLEELLRIYDYNKLVSSLPTNFPTATANGKKKYDEKQKMILKTYLTNQGWQEIITYSLISSEMKHDFNYAV